jgi:hypothetical protein
LRRGEGGGGDRGDGRLRPDRLHVVDGRQAGRGSGQPNSPAKPSAAGEPDAGSERAGKTRCQISRTAVGCEAQFANPPVKDGVPANGVNVTSDGKIRWLVGNLGDIPTVTLDYRTYEAVGWTIAAGESGTRFTNDRTGHGMFVSIERVQAF